MPIIKEPFKRLAMDIVGPLPRSQSGNRFILVICDYATRYPKAVQLKTIDTENVTGIDHILLQSWHPQGDPDRPREQ